MTRVCVPFFDNEIIPNDRKTDRYEKTENVGNSHRDNHDEPGHAHARPRRDG